MAQVKSLTVSQAEQSKDSALYVLNTAGGKGQQKGLIHFSVTEGNGKTSVVSVPVTFIPFDLTGRATKRALLESPDFRTIVMKGLLKIISEADAEEMLKSEEAQKEHRRLLDIDHSSEIPESQQSSEVQSLKAEAAGNIGGFAMSLAHTADGEEEAICSNLRNNADVLTQAELKYIVDNSTFHKVKTLAAEYIVR